MNTVEELPRTPNTPWSTILTRTIYILLALFVFLFALDLMISSLEHIGKDAAQTIILATSNPFTGLFIGLLVTAIIQSSSAATSMVVALTASGAMTIEGAVPIIMGANIGTTFTCALVSLGFITRKKEFKRAVAAGTYHSFFNILTAVILFPAEYYYGFISRTSEYLATTFFHEPIDKIAGDFSLLGSGFKPLINFLVNSIDNGIVLIVLSVALIFGSIVFFRKVLSGVLGFGSQEKFQRFFFRSPLKSLVWGLLTTAAIRSSTVTTSLVVPLVAKKVVKLRSAVPFIMGANVGTTITAFIAAMFNSNAAISIAIAHFLFNFIGVLIFFLIPYVKDIPVNLATGLGELTKKHRLIGFLYLILTFFLIPFVLIYMSKDSVMVQQLTYRDNGERSFSQIAKIVKNQIPPDWNNAAPQKRPTSKTLVIYRKNNLLFYEGQLFEFNTPGTCREGVDYEGPYRMCVTEIISLPHPSGQGMDSVYVFVKSLTSPESDSSTVKYLINASANILNLKQRRSKSGAITETRELISAGKK